MKLDWIVVHQDLTTCECKQCGTVEQLPIKLPIKIDYYISLLKTFEKHHRYCGVSTPEEGDRYRHFKGNEYKVIFVQRDYPGDLDDGDKSLFVSLHKTIEYTAASDIKWGETVVFYEGMDGIIYGRSLSNFTEVVDSGDRQCPRFELIEESE